MTEPEKPKFYRKDMSARNLISKVLAFNANPQEVKQAWMQDLVANAPVLPEKEVVDPKKEADRFFLAANKFKAAPVKNFTIGIKFLFDNIEENSFGEITSATWLREKKEHIVNKWERAARGRELPGYSTPADKQNTNIGEANQLGIDLGTYSALPPKKKMQYAFLDYANGKNNNENGVLGLGYGDGSYLVIAKDKCMTDGFIHIGDSNVHLFPQPMGHYKRFDGKLSLNKRLRDAFIGNTAGKGYGIEVNLANGVNLPGDIEKFCIVEQAVKDVINVLTYEARLDEEGNEKTDTELLKKAKDKLNEWYGKEKVEFI